MPIPYILGYFLDCFILLNLILLGISILIWLISDREPFKNYKFMTTFLLISFIIFLLLRGIFINNVEKGEFAVKNISSVPENNIYEAEGNGYTFGFYDAYYFKIYSEIFCNDVAYKDLFSDKDNFLSITFFIKEVKVDKKCIRLKIKDPAKFAKNIIDTEKLSNENSNSISNTNKIVISMAQAYFDGVLKVPSYLEIEEVR